MANETPCFSQSTSFTQWQIKHPLRMKCYDQVLSECSACGCGFQCAFADMQKGEILTGSKQDKQMRGKDGVTNVRGRLKRSMKGWLLHVSKQFFGFFKLGSLLNSCLARFRSCFFCSALTCPFCLWKVYRGYSAFLHIIFFANLEIHPLHLPLILFLHLTLSTSLHSPLCSDSS